MAKQPLLPEGSETCIWVRAGLLSYKICDRGFECEHCPLDAALQGRPDTEASAPPPAAPFTFPDDRRYSSTHTWVQGEPGGRLRLGIDALAATLLRPVIGVRLREDGPVRTPGDQLADLDLGIGSLRWRTPVALRLVTFNGHLHRNPSLVVEAPYGEGWLVEATCAEGDRSFSELHSASAVRKRAALDLAGFRRRIATQLLAEEDPVGATLQDGGEPILDLRQIVGGERYVEALTGFLG